MLPFSDNFKGAPSDWMKLMTEVFDAWAVERVYAQQQFSMQAKPYPQTPALSPMQPYAQMQPYPQTQYPHSPPYQYAGLQPPLTNIPMSPPLTPSTPSSMYASPALQHVVPDKREYRLPLDNVAEMPAELPGNLLRSSPAFAPAVAPAPAQSIISEV